jgi:hypothetical protein
MICRVIEKHLSNPSTASCLVITQSTIDYFKTKGKKLPTNDHNNNSQNNNNSDNKLTEDKLEEIREALQYCSKRYFLFQCIKIRNIILFFLYRKVKSC